MTKITRRIITAIFITCAFITASAQSKKMERAVIAKAQMTVVSRIEKGMPRQPFAVWFQELIGRKTPINWSVNDCGEQTGTSADRGRDFPMCVEANAKMSADFYISVNIQYGTFKRGITRGNPVIRLIFCGDESTSGGSDSESLSDLRELLKRRKMDADFFNPNDGVFYISDKIKPQGFENFEEMYLQTEDSTAQKALVPVKPNGGISFGQKEFAMRNIIFDSKGLSFETVAIGGISFKFDGKFSKIKLDSHGAQDGEKVLQGHLIKLVNGNKTAEADLIFSFYLQGE